MQETESEYSPVNNESHLLVRKSVHSNKSILIYFLNASNLVTDTYFHENKD